MNLRKLEMNLNKLYEKTPNNRIKMLLGIFYDWFDWSMKIDLG